jgi:transcriptional regulator of arginine metabolism
MHLYALFPHNFAMHTAADSKQRRREAILELLANGTVTSQAELAERLAEREMEVNQATLSRDLRDLRVVKGPEGYRLPLEADAVPTPEGALVRALRDWLESAAAAQNQVVLRTPPGCAQPLAVAIDDARLEVVVGTLAGDDTVLVIAPDARRARSLVAHLRQLAGHPRPLRP